jgi:hypothetical protein
MTKQLKATGFTRVAIVRIDIETVDVSVAAPSFVTSFIGILIEGLVWTILRGRAPASVRWIGVRRRNVAVRQHSCGPIATGENFPAVQHHRNGDPNG